MDSIAIELKNVTKIFNVNKQNSIYSTLKNLRSKNSGLKKIIAIDNLSLSIKKGETIGLIGLNGGGKTTLLRLIGGIYSPDSGTINIVGRIAPLLQIGTGFNAEFNAKENIVIYGMLLGLKKNEIESKVETILDFAELKRFRNLKLKNYSSGMKAKLGFSTAIQINPEILLVDEVLSVGDAAFQQKSFEAFLSFKKNNKTIVLTTHNINTISKVADRVVLLDGGKLVNTGKPDEIIPIYNEIVKSKKAKN